MSLSLYYIGTMKIELKSNFVYDAMDEHLSELSASRIELRERIITEAIDAFTKNGIRNITMDDIANRLAISKRTLYEIFKDKEDLLIACVIRQQKEIEEFLIKVSAESENVLEVILKFYKKSLEIYHRTSIRFFEDMNKYPRVKAIARHNSEENSENTVEFFNLGIRQGIFRSDVNFEIVHLLVREQVNILMNTDLCSAYSFVEVYESIMFVFMRGISTEKGQKILDDFIKEY